MLDSTRKEIQLEIDKEDNWNDFPIYRDSEIIWKKKPEGRFYYHSLFNNNKMSIRINNFPEEPGHTLFENDDIILNFNDWPENWKISSDEI
jgi:hypothetical protein